MKKLEKEYQLFKIREQEEMVELKVRFILGLYYLYFSILDFT